MRPAPAILEALLVAAPPSLAALYPLVFVMRVHSTTHAFRVEAVLRPAAVLVAAALLVLAASRLLSDSWRKASVTATSFFVILGLWPAIVDRTDYGWYVPVLFMAASAAAAIVVSRLLGTTPGLIAAWAVSAAVVWAAAGTFVTMRALWPKPAWAGVTERLVREARSFDVRRGTGRPDIYYIVLDGMGRPDVLEQLYGLDVRAQLRRLEALGVVVPPASRSNYSQTQLSLASSLNVQYLTALAPVMGDALDRRPLNELIVNGGVMRRLKEHGYEFVVIGSLASATSGHADADECYCRLPDGPTELEHALLGVTPFRGDAIERRALSAHYRQVKRALNLIGSVESDRPVFLLTHIVSPHPPFVAGADGSERIGQARFSYYDGDAFPGTREEYIAGYRAQASFMLERTVSLIERIVARSPDAVVVVHSDHGPGLGLVNTDAVRTDAWERLSIFSAYYGGSRPAPVPDDVSPVNALRWALRSAIGAELPMLPNRSYISDYLHPYRWREVPATELVTQP